MAYTVKKIGVTEVAQESEIKYEIINEIGVITCEGKWRLELNRISWNGREPKYDLRKWSEGHQKMGKGITLTDEEIIKLSDILQKEKEYLTENS